MNKEEQIKILDKICPLRKGQTTQRRIRHEFFQSIETEIQAYLLGFHVADGCVDDPKCMLRVELTETDVEIVQLFKDYVGPDATMYCKKARITKNPHNGKEIHIKPSWAVDIYSKSIRDDLSNLGYGARKTYLELSIPKIKEDLIPHFLRGYFDGDGCFSWCVYKGYHDHDQLKKSVYFVSNTKTLLSEIKNYLDQKGIVAHLRTKKNGNFCLEIQSMKGVKDFYKLIYSNSNFKLNRKYEKFNHFVNTEVTQLIAEYRNAQKVSASDSNNPSTSAEHPTGVKMCAELTGNCENSEIKSSEDNNVGMEWNDSSECC